MLDQRKPMTLTTGTDCLTKRTSIPNSVAVVKSASKINILVVNVTLYNMQLHKNTYIGNVEIIKSIIR